MIIRIDHRTFRVDVDRAGPRRIREERHDYANPGCQVIVLVTRWVRGQIPTAALPSRLQEMVS